MFRHSVTLPLQPNTEAASKRHRRENLLQFSANTLEIETFTGIAQGT